MNAQNIIDAMDNKELQDMDAEFRDIIKSISTLCSTRKFNELKLVITHVVKNMESISSLCNTEWQRYAWISCDNRLFHVNCKNHGFTLYTCIKEEFIASIFKCLSFFYEYNLEGISRLLSYIDNVYTELSPLNLSFYRKMFRRFNLDKKLSCYYKFIVYSLPFLSEGLVYTLELRDMHVNFYMKGKIVVNSDELFNKKKLEAIKFSAGQLTC